MKNECILKKPEQVTFDLTDRCQMKCTTCTKWQTNPADVIDKELTTEEWKNVIKNLQEWIGEGFWFCFSGGEPFLREDIYEIASYAKSLGLHPSTMSNAFSLEKHYEKIVDSDIESINISLNAVNDKSAHDVARGRECSCEKAIAAILELNRLKKEKNSNLGINISTVMMPENLDEVIPLVEFITLHKLNGIMFQLIDDVDSFHAYSELAGMNTSKYKMPEILYKMYVSMGEKAIPLMDRLIEMKKAGYSIYNSYEQLEAFKVFFKNPHEILKSINCDVGSTNIAIDPYGDVRLCFNMEPVGSVKTQTPAEIWESIKSEKCRKLTKSCKMYCRMLNCNFKQDFAKRNNPPVFKRIKSFLCKVKSKIFLV